MDTAPSSASQSDTQRKISHNAVEVRRRQRISTQLDRLKTILNTPKADKASLLSEAISRLSMLTRKCHTLETELAVLKGRAPPEQPHLLAATAGDAEDEDAMDMSHAHNTSSTGYPSIPWAAGMAGPSQLGPSGAGSHLQHQPPPGPFPMQRPVHPAQQMMQQAHAAARHAEVAAVQQAEAAEVQLQQWVGLGESSMMELIQKDQHTVWSYVCTREGVQGFTSSLPIPSEVSADGNTTRVPTPPEPERLDYCIKSETIIEMEPEQLAAIYMNIEERHRWHSACQDSALLEDIWPNQLRVAVFTYRTELLVFPRGACSLLHRASRRLPDGRTQVVITDRSVLHPAMPARRYFVFMTVYPSGMMLTPVQHGDRTYSHVKLISHFHLRGTIAQPLLGRIKVNRMVEACCFNYLHEFKTHVLAHYAPRDVPPAPPLPEPQQQQQQQLLRPPPSQQQVPPRQEGPLVQQEQVHEEKQQEPQPEEQHVEPKQEQEPQPQGTWESPHAQFRLTSIERWAGHS